MDPALMAEASDLEIMMRQFTLIIAPRFGVPLLLELVLILAVDQGDAAIREGWIDLRARHHLDRDDVEIEGAKQIESLLIGSRGHEEVRNENRFSRTP